MRRDYTAADVCRLSGSLRIEHTLARHGAERLWQAIHEGSAVRALGALTGNQAVQQVRAGLQAIYLSGWQVAGDANSAFQMYPDQSLYPVDSVPAVIRRINNALRRADELHHAENDGRHRLVRAHRGRCRGRLRGRTQRLRAHETHDRGRRRCRAL